MIEMPVRLSPKLLAFLERLEQGPAPRPKGTIVGPAARRAGFTEDEVAFGAERMSVREARARLGDRWFLSSKFTGNELLTEEGRDVLAQHRSAG